MATMKRNFKNLGKPPKMDKIKGNLDEPEVAPSSPKTPVKKKIDGRSLRKTNFTEQFNTKVPVEFKDDLRIISKKLNATYGKVLVDSIKKYKLYLEETGQI